MRHLFSITLAVLLVFSSFSPTYISGAAQDSIEISGVTDGGVYNTDVKPTITASGSYTATLDSYRRFTNGDTVSYEGSHTLSVKLSTGTEKTISFKIDKTAPSYYWSGVSEKLNKAPELYVYSYDSEQVQLFYNINGEASTATLTRYNNFYFPGIKEDGSYTLEFYTKDAAGNVSRTTTAAFTIDSKGPELWVTGVEEGGVYQTVTPTFGANEGTVSARLNWSNYLSGTPITEHDSYELTITVRDQLNNKTEKKIKFSVDTKGPELQRYSYYGYIENEDEYSVTEPLKLKFNEEVLGSTINEKSIQLKNLDTGQLEPLDFSRLSQDVKKEYYQSSSIVTIPFKEKLKSLSRYRLTIDTTKISDKVGNMMKPVSENAVFTVEMKTRKFFDAPVVSKTNVDNADINSAADLKVYFSEDLEEDKVDSSQILLTNLTTGLVEAIRTSIRENELTVEPVLGLTENTSYQLQIQTNAVRSKDNVPMNKSFVKQFKTADLFKLVSGPDTNVSEKRPKFVVTFTNQVAAEFVSNDYFRLFENDRSNSQGEIELRVALSADKKSVEVYPFTALSEHSNYKLVVDNDIVDIYGLRLVNKDSLSFPIQVGEIGTTIAKPTDATWKATGFNTIELSFTDNSSGEEGYYIEIDGDPSNSDYVPSVKGIHSTVTHKLVFDRPAGTHAIRIIPAIDEGDEDYGNAVSVSQIKLLTKKPEKPAEVRAKLLKDGTLEWTWKDVPADYEGAASYIIIRDSIREKVSSDNRTRSNEGQMVEKLDLSKEKVVNNMIYRYISRSVNVEGADGDDFESDKVLYKIKLPAKAPTPFLKRYEYDRSEGAYQFTWTMKDSKNTAKAYRYIIKRNQETVETSEVFETKTGQSTYSDALESYRFQYYYSPGDVWQVVVVTINSVGVETESEAKTITVVN